MKRVATLLLIGLSLGAAVGCGGGSDADPADEEAVRELISEVNRATADRDAEAFCAVIAPSALKRTFQTASRCARETGAILKQAGEQPALEVDTIEITGDRATVTFKGRNGEAAVIREDGRWYIPLDSETPTTTDAAPASGAGP